MARLSGIYYQDATGATSMSVTLNPLLRGTTLKPFASISSFLDTKNPGTFTIVPYKYYYYSWQYSPTVDGETDALIRGRVDYTAADGTVSSILIGYQNYYTNSRLTPCAGIPDITSLFLQLRTNQGGQIQESTRAYFNTGSTINVPSNFISDQSFIDSLAISLKGCDGASAQTLSISLDLDNTAFQSSIQYSTPAGYVNGALSQSVYPKVTYGRIARLLDLGVTTTLIEQNENGFFIKGFDSTTLKTRQEVYEPNYRYPEPFNVHVSS